MENKSDLAVNEPDDNNNFTKHFKDTINGRSMVIDKGIALEMQNVHHKSYVIKQRSSDWFNTYVMTTFYFCLCAIMIKITFGICLSSDVMGWILNSYREIIIGFLHPLVDISNNVQNGSTFLEVITLMLGIIGITVNLRHKIWDRLKDVLKLPKFR